MSVAAEKARAREEAALRRAAVRDREDRSTRIMDRLATVGALAPPGPVLWYLDIRTEVRTTPTVLDLLARGLDVAVPFCDGPELTLWRPRGVSDLEPGRWGILEPSATLRASPERRVEPADLAKVVVPGLAFTERGDRLGYGAGYYDRLLARTRALKVGVCFEAQIVPALPVDETDVPMDRVVTEKRVIAVGP